MLVKVTDLFTAGLESTLNKLKSINKLLMPVNKESSVIGETSTPVSKSSSVIGKTLTPVNKPLLSAGIEFNSL